MANQLQYACINYICFNYKILNELPFIRLSELSQQVGKVIGAAFAGQNFWVLADVSNHSFKSPGNYHYFDLVEKDPSSNSLLARFSARAWGIGSEKILEFEKVTGQRFTGGIHILVNVSVNYHPTFGLQLSLNTVDSNFTLGALAQQRQATLARLVRDNPEHVWLKDGVYSTFNQQLRLPAVIQRIAVITATDSAGWEDFEHSLVNNRYGYHFYLDPYFSAVQGDHNATQLVEALVNIFNRNRLYDAVMIIRGGGAQSDFLIFDNYSLSRAIARFPVPVFTGIGHQKNETISDLMAHTSVKTPTKAAEMIIAHNRIFEENIVGIQRDTVIKVQRLFSERKNKLVNVNNRITKSTQDILYQMRMSLVKLTSMFSVQPKYLLSRKAHELILNQAIVKNSCKSLLAGQDAALKNQLTMIRLMSPERILRKGFAIVKVGDQIITDPEKISQGGQLSVILADTEIIATVDSKKRYDGTDFKL